MLTKQEIFDTVVAHLRSAPKQARGKLGCRYRAPDGGKCAIGCLLTDAEYTPMMEGLSVKGLATSPTVSKDGGLGDGFMLPDRFSGHLDFLYDLQVVHDNTTHWKSFSSAKDNDGNVFPKYDGPFGPDGEAALKTFATKWKVTYTPPVAA